MTSAAISSLLLFVSIVVASSYASDENYYCCTPEKYSAGIFVYTYTRYKFYKGKGLRYYNATLGMTATFVNTTVNGVVYTTSSYYESRTGTYYNVMGGKCTKGTLVIPGIDKKRPNCIPDTAHISRSFIVGGLHDGLELVKIDTPVKNGQIQTILAKKHCIPVQEDSYFGGSLFNHFEVSVATSMTIINLKPVVKDPSVFEIPDICKKAVS